MRSPMAAFSFPADRRWLDTVLAWYFVLIWGAGFLATKVGLQHAGPFTFLMLRYAIGVACMIPILLIFRPRWPATRAEWGHVMVAGLLMHAVHLSGSHYSQYFGLSAGITALVMALQPLATALIAARWMSEPLVRRQWLGVALGLAGVGLVVWHKMDIKELPIGSLVGLTIGLAGVTVGTLYQKVFCPSVDLKSGSFIQFAVCAVALTPLSFAFEGAQVRWSWELVAVFAYLVILASILATNVLHVLMRHGEAARVTSLIYLTPIVAVLLEYPMFGVVPSALSVVGIAVTCLGVALVTMRARSAPTVSGTAD